MDVATRLSTRTRAEPFLSHERNGVPEDSGTDSESLNRRKFQRTAAAENDPPSEATFRKPSLPASASRNQLDNRQSFSQRRRSTVRDHTRVPSGPREFPSPGKRVGSGSISSLAPSMSDSVSTARSHFPSSSTSRPAAGKSSSNSRFSLGRPPSTGTESPITPADRSSTNFDFIPAVNFDDFQNSLASYDGNGPLLSDFPAIGGRRSLLGDAENIPTGKSLTSGKPPPPKPEPSQEQGVRRSQSLRRRLSAVPGVKQIASSLASDDHGSGSPASTGLSLRTRRQSSAPQGPPPPGPVPLPAGTGHQSARKSIGPGLISSMMEGRKTSQPLPSSHSESILKPALARNGSLSKASRRTTIQPSAIGGLDMPRMSTLTATTQSRANKVKSLQPPPREPDVSTPGSRGSAKGTPNRAHTPSSSGNKRQSTISGRASGLGARTISPTDARRLKRLSMMQAPPMPTAATKVPATPQAEMPPLKLEAPRFMQASPSLIPRKTNDGTPASGRTSPEVRPATTSGHSLTSKSSFQSLLSASASTSRLPTPKSRSAHSSTAQYSDPEEMVPPVPAIPKAYESPRESDVPFFSGTKSQSGSLAEPTLTDFDPDASLASSSTPAKSHRSIADFTPGARRKASNDLTRLHARNNTVDAIEKSATMASQTKPTRPVVDETGRKNNNLQPLRLPPLNLMPINTSAGRAAHMPRPSQEIESRVEYMNAQTPEPKRTAKTPSTPMTASKATFFRRQEEEAAKQGPVRSSTSHFALRELMQLDESTMKFFDDNDLDFLNGGVQIPGPKSRNAITPFASGSLPKGSGEFTRVQGRPSRDFDEFSLEKPNNTQGSKTSGTALGRIATNQSTKISETPSSIDSPTTESSQSDPKKDGTGATLRRRLSLGWRRSSSKAATHADHKASPSADVPSAEKEKIKAQKRMSEMPPPRLPASAAWTADAPAIPRPSLDSLRKPSVASYSSLSITTSSTEVDVATAATKTRSQHFEQPQAANAGNRASSWGNIAPSSRSSIKPTSSNLKPRHTLTASTISAIIKDKDDLAADEEMRRLSQKRRDVDSAARESEQLKARAIARSPMAPERVLHDRNYSLNIFERGEIMDYEKEGIYFTGTKNARKIIGTLSSTSALPGDDKNSKVGNYGYDDERGDYNIVLGDHLAYRYEVVDVLGKGSFGQVVRCVDHKAGGVVAVKIIRNKKRFHQQALVEVGILGRLRDWDPEGTHATLSITSSFYFRSHLCIVTPCLSINLYEFIRAHNFVGFSLPLIRRFGRQMLACLVLLQNKRIIHCDLKPENILLYEARKADIRVIDFGSSCKEEEKVYTYIQSRFYRSPEVILGSSYGLGIDMWSLGCILAELWTGYPLFPGENEQEQLACIMEIFGPPDRHLVDRCTRKKLFFDSVGKPRVTVSSKGRRRRPSSKTLSQALKSEDEAFLDFITRCLRWDPERRMKPNEAVTHPFITNQPFHQRPGIPDEARRSTRPRPAAAAPTANGGIPSPVKRVHTTSGTVSTLSTATSGQHVVQQTPNKERTRGIPETPQTALRNNPPAPANRGAQNSPSKQSTLNRRLSNATHANAAAVAGSKRASNGAVIGANIGAQNGPPSGSSSRQVSGSSTAANLAQLAARESLSNATRWRA